MLPQTQSRRARLRAETTAEIKAIAIAHINARGPDAISLRAIAREMGMTANAIYSYFPTRDDLVSALIEDLYTSLIDTLVAARDAEPAHEPVRRILAWTEAFRAWALVNPCGFRLIYGDPVPGYHPKDRPAKAAERRICVELAGLAAAAWPSAEPVQADDTYTWSNFDTDLVATVRERFPDLPPAGVALTLRIWARMHGLVSLEIYGHLGSQTHEPGKVYVTEMRDLLRSLGFTA